MSSESAKILLTGRPSCGKTTAVMQIVSNLKPEKVAGFYTQEIRRRDFAEYSAAQDATVTPLL